MTLVPGLVHAVQVGGSADVLAGVLRVHPAVVNFINILRVLLTAGSLPIFGHAQTIWSISNPIDINSTD
jgi:hypothetical protein